MRYKKALFDDDFSSFPYNETFLSKDTHFFFSVFLFLNSYLVHTLANVLRCPKKSQVNMKNSLLVMKFTVVQNSWLLSLSSSIYYYYRSIASADGFFYISDVSLCVLICLLDHVLTKLYPLARDKFHTRFEAISRLCHLARN